MSYGVGVGLQSTDRMSFSIKASDLMNSPIAARDKGEIEMMLDAGFDHLKRLHQTIERLEARLNPVLTLTPAQPTSAGVESTSCVLSSRLHEVNVGLMQAHDRLLSMIDRCHL